MENDETNVVAITDDVTICNSVSECAVCGRTSSFVGWLVVTMDPKYAELISPYPPGIYKICHGCLLKTFGVPLPQDGK